MCICHMHVQVTLEGLWLSGRAYAHVHMSYACAGHPGRAVALREGICTCACAICMCRSPWKGCGSPGGHMHMCMCHMHVQVTLEGLWLSGRAYAHVHVPYACA